MANACCGSARGRPSRESAARPLGYGEPVLSRMRAAASQALERYRRAGHPTYDYMYSPAQLGFLAGEVERTDPLAGSIVEIGCGYGATTVFLDRHLSDMGSDKRYYAVDTFGVSPPTMSGPSGIVAARGTSHISMTTARRRSSGRWS